MMKTALLSVSEMSHYSQLCLCRMKYTRSVALLKVILCHHSANIYQALCLQKQRSHGKRMLLICIIVLD